MCFSTRLTNHVVRTSGAGWSRPPPLYIGDASEAVPAPREGPFSPKIKTEKASCVLGAEGWLMCLARTTHAHAQK